MLISYNWLKSYVPKLPEAEKLADVFTYHLCEVESVEKIQNGDTIFDLNILPNRAHDLLSHQGIARELAGQLALEFKDVTSMYKILESSDTKLQIESNTEDCRRYTGRIIRNIKVEKSPEWVVKYLESIGQRSINNIVDATNIVMYDCGQPTHVFDLNKMKSKISVRKATNGEKIKLLGGMEKELKKDDTLITDGEKILALAGVKGGTEAEVDENTTEIILEVANFEPTSTRKTARRLGILTDSAKRFENDLSPTLCDFAMTELSALIFDMCPDSKFENIVNFEQKPPEKLRKILFTTKQINNLLGSQIIDMEISQILQNYAYKFEKDREVFHIEIPAMRLDLSSISDVAEEFGRVIGYDMLTPVIPRINFDVKPNVLHEKIVLSRKILLENGYSEVMNYTFAKTGKVEVAYGASGEKFLRTNLSDEMKKSYELNRLNAPILGLDEIKIFEIGNVFPKLGVEETKIVIADKKGVKEFLVKDFAEKISDEKNLAQFLILPKENENTKFINNFNAKYFTKNERFSAWSLFPFIARDVAVWVPENTDPKIILDIFFEHGKDLLARPPRLFDKFSKDGKTSFAFRLVFQAQNKTLTDAETYTIVDNINNTLKNKGFTPR